MTLLQLFYTYSPWMNYWFHSAPIDANAWLRIILASYAIYLIVGIEKWYRNQTGLIKPEIGIIGRQIGIVVNSVQVDPGMQVQRFFQPNFFIPVHPQSATGSVHMMVFGVAFIGVSSGKQPGPAPY